MADESGGNRFSSQFDLWYLSQSNNNFEATAMANGTSDTPAYQTERVHRELDASIEAGRAACQAAILINGGAATALLRRGNRVRRGRWYARPASPSVVTRLEFFRVRYQCGSPRERGRCLAGLD
jgi:hypothetical protein